MLGGGAGALVGKAAGGVAGGAAAGGLGSALMGAMGGPVGIGLGLLNFGLGMAQKNSANAAKRQAYVNQTAFQDATTQFNYWQASMNAKRTDLNQQYKYWGDTVRYNQNAAYVQQMRAVEFAKEINQAEVVFETRASAMADYASQSQAIAAQFQERAMQQAVAVQQYRYRALQSSAAYQAAGQEGNSMDRYVRNYAKQAGDFAALKEIEAGLREGQYTRAQQGQIAQYLSRYNSQQFYERQPYMDPVSPFPPLATMVNPPGPSFRGAAPSSGTSGLQVAGLALSGVSTAMNFGNNVKKLAEG